MITDCINGMDNMARGANDSVFYNQNEQWNSALPLPLCLGF
jgi:hypothetical protein